MRELEVGVFVVKKGEEKVKNLIKGRIVENCFRFFGLEKKISNWEGFNFNLNEDVYFVLSGMFVIFTVRNLFIFWEEKKNLGDLLNKIIFD